MPTTLTRSARQLSSGSRVVTGEASPYYLFHPLAAERAHATVPNAKILVLLRDPVERTYSRWKERRRSNAEELDFQAALEAEPGRLAGERERLGCDPTYQSYAWEQQSYATQSMYGPPLEVWRAKFGSAQVKVLASESYYQDPLGTLRDVDAFLGLRPRERSSGRVRNAAPETRISPALRSELLERFADSNHYLRTNIGSTLPMALSDLDAPLRLKPFPPGRRGVLLPTNSPRAAAVGLAMYTASRPLVVKAQRASHHLTSHLGVRWIPTKSILWSPPWDSGHLGRTARAVGLHHRLV